jgi:hypothetical protein
MPTPRSSLRPILLNHLRDIREADNPLESTLLVKTDDARDLQVRVPTTEPQSIGHSIRSVPRQAAFLVPGVTSVVFGGVSA